MYLCISLKKLIVSSIFLIFISVSSGSLVTTRIINGANATLGQFPAQVSIQNKNVGHSCGGTLLTLRVVLTAAHCMQNSLRVMRMQFLILAGDIYSTENASETRQVRKVKQAVQHPLYNCDNALHDIGLITLNTSFQESAMVRPIKMSTIRPTVDTACTISGWGTTDPLAIEGASKILQYSIVKVFHDIECKQGSNFPYDKKSMICAGVIKKTGVCSGDSGGPLICNGVVAGIVSTSLFPCVKAGGGATFTNVEHYGCFINKYIEWDGDVWHTFIKELPEVARCDSSNISIAYTLIVTFIAIVKI